jgi:16S rRNA (cytidine1402-2'-O)-methyltransferase
LAERYQSNSENPRGEFVIVIGPPTAGQLESLQRTQLEEVSEPLRQALEHMNTKSAVQYIASSTGLSKRVLYKRALELKQIKE